MTDTRIIFICNNCSLQEAINEGEEFNDLEGEECSFCRDGVFGEMTIIKVEEGKFIEFALKDGKNI